jgi:hypothetical protein
VVSSLTISYFRIDLLIESEEMTFNSALFDTIGELQARLWDTVQLTVWTPTLFEVSVSDGVLDPETIVVLVTVSVEVVDCVVCGADDSLLKYP